MAGSASSPEDRHEICTAWAKEKGVKVNGVEPVKIADSGVGIVAQRKIEAGEVLVHVPVTALLTINSVPAPFRILHEGISVHGLLASFLAFGGDERAQYAAWENSWPSLRELQESMPLLWPDMLNEPLDSYGDANLLVNRKAEPAFVLPPTIGGKWCRIREYFDRQDAGLLYRQKQKLKLDWAVVSKVFVDRSLLHYTYYWLIVNTRSFYFDALGGHIPDCHDDRMVMCPFVDYFNHKDHGCVVTFGENGYTVISDRTYDVGEELRTSYGAHGNDFLLVEYGFTLDKNKWDSLPLDDFFCTRQTDSDTKSRLKRWGYFGNYVLSSEGVCHRTQVAVRTQTLHRKQWEEFVERGETADEGDEARVDSYICAEVLQVYYKEAENALIVLGTCGDGKIQPTVNAALTKRWKQILRLLRSAFQNAINPRTQAQMRQTFDASSSFFQ